MKGRLMTKNPDHQDNLVALRRIEGQVRGVQKMIEERKYCIDILNQIHAVKGALSKVEERILENSGGFFRFRLRFFRHFLPLLRIFLLNLKPKYKRKMSF